MIDPQHINVRSSDYGEGMVRIQATLAFHRVIVVTKTDVAQAKFDLVGRAKVRACEGLIAYIKKEAAATP